MTQATGKSGRYCYYTCTTRIAKDVHACTAKNLPRLLVDEIKLDGNDLLVCGSHRRLADAIGFMEKRKLSEVPSFVNDWRARRESNPRPSASETDTLSS